VANISGDLDGYLKEVTALSLFRSPRYRRGRSGPNTSRPSCNTWSKYAKLGRFARKRVIAYVRDYLKNIIFLR